MLNQTIKFIRFYHRSILAIILVILAFSTSFLTPLQAQRLAPNQNANRNINNRETVVDEVEGTLNQRIISLSPLLTQIIFDIGAGYQIQGVTSLCELPKGEEKRPIIGGVTINIKEVINLKPDKVLGMGKQNMLGKEFESHNVPTRFFKHPQRLRSIHQLILEVGASIDELDRAQELVKGIKAKLQAILQSPQPRFRKKVLIIFWPKPLMGVGLSHPASEMIEMAGGINILRHRLPFTAISDTLLLEHNPDVIILTNPDDLHIIKKYPLLLSKTDGSPRQIISNIDPKFFIMPGARYIEGINKVKSALERR